MATFDSVNGGGNAAGTPAADVLQAVFDAATLNLAAADVVELIAVPAGTWVEKVHYEVLTADATQTLNIGDGANVAGYVAAADVGTAANSGIGAGAFASGKYYAAADTIDLEVPATKALDTLKIRVTASVVKFGKAA